MIACGLWVLLLTDFDLVQLRFVHGKISEPGVKNPYYQVADYFGSRVLEHNESNRFERNVKVVWTTHAAVDKAGRVWIADRVNHQIVMVEAETRYVPWPAYYMAYAGMRKKNGFYDGIRTQALFDMPVGIALCEPEGHLILFVSDSNNHVIRKLNFTTNRVSTVAGLNGHPGLRDGSSNRARFNSPMSLGVDSECKDLFVLDNGRRIRHVNMEKAVAVVTTLVDGACRGSSNGQTLPYVIEMRDVGCHADWLAKDVHDPDLETFNFDVLCVGHQATCGPRQHPALHDDSSRNLILPPPAAANNS